MDSTVFTADHAILQFAVGFALCAIACGLVVAGRRSVRPVVDSEHWPLANGLVIESAVAAVRSGRRQRFKPVVRYRYEVGGHRYEGSGINWAAVVSFRKYTGARRMLDGYRPGGPVAVHYDPRRPSVAVLQPGSVTDLRPLFAIPSTAAVYALFTIGHSFFGS